LLSKIFDVKVAPISIKSINKRTVLVKFSWEESEKILRH